MKKIKDFIQISIIIIFILLQKISFAEEKKFKIIAEETPIRSFYEVVEPDKKNQVKTKNQMNPKKNLKLLDLILKLLVKFLIK